MTDTRIKIYTLIDYETFYPNNEIPEIDDLIKEIPSITLINYISGFNLNLYLRENDEKTGSLQFKLVDSLLSKCSKTTQSLWVSCITDLGKNGHRPIFHYSYSNLIFYEKVFRHFNDKPSRDLTSDEAQKVFDTFLVINSYVNQKIKAGSDEIKKLNKNGKIEKFTLTNFIYQKDYSSSLDYSNQVTRGAEFFRYLENNQKFCIAVQDYYKEKKVAGFKEMFKNLLWIFSKSEVEKEFRCQLINISESDKQFQNFSYLNTLFINKYISNYSPDESFSAIRNHFLFQFDQKQFFLLNINFLFDHFYRSQVFSFNRFLQDKRITKDFLSIKAKEFMEEIYVPKIIKKCFPNYKLYFGEECLNSSNEELCDIYIRKKENIIISEFKDVILNAKSKNSFDESLLFSELEKKFEKNQKNKPKGITQLLNSIEHIEKDSIIFDQTLPDKALKLYPIIIYTDISFSLDGVNKIFKEKFNQKLQKLNIQNIEVRDITFINLSFFEFQENKLFDNQIDIFQIIDQYHHYCALPNFELTPFEVFVRSFLTKTYNDEEVSQSKFYKETIKSILQ